jgi:hypothetical protein
MPTHHFDRSTRRRTLSSINLTVSVVVGIEHEDDVLNHGNDNEGVEDEREDADEVVRVPDAARERARVHVELNCCRN